jgi:hypothetical protein
VDDLPCAGVTSAAPVQLRDYRERRLSRGGTAMRLRGAALGVTRSCGECRTIPQRLEGLVIPRGIDADTRRQSRLRDPAQREA